VVTPPAKREAVRLAGESYGLTERRACRLIGATRSMVRYVAKRPNDEALRAQLVAFAGERRRWGYRRLAVLVRRAGTRANLKRVYRVYREAGLAVRRRKRKLRMVARLAQPLLRPTRPIEWWAMDFLKDTLAGTRPFRVFTLEDLFTRDALALTLDFSLPALRVIRELDLVAATRGYPQYVRVDNGPEFISQALDAWAYQHGVQLVFIDPGKPVQNAHVESFNGKVRDEFLNEHWFVSIAEAQVLATRFRLDFNTVRPHSALKNLTPEEFRQRWEADQRAASVSCEDQQPLSTTAEVT
jgi:putative transposase